MELTRENFRAMIYYDFRRGLSRQECIDQLTSTFDDKAPSCALAKDSHKILPNFWGMHDEDSPVVNYRKLCTGTRSIMPPFVRSYCISILKKLCTGTRSIMPPFVNLDEDMISIDNCEKETLSIIVMEYIDTLDQDDYSVKRMKRFFKGTFHDAYMKNFLSRLRIIGDIMLNSNLNELHS
ncbi:hypothetical protein ALC57_15687 [Trachymyrmex cornetzi]|uniref:Mos1 transposase HTH domain-containing protein n=1 Tax=Trachymyrmex cornetzi TaxID=471704 RepID=A0A151IWI9_9HYME|nr:hypothetical protein ALC57_15687 [Trachymyrmex cornetzi]